MHRPIKFRAWDKKSMWDMGMLLNQVDWEDLSYLDYIIQGQRWNKYTKLPILMQFTGLLDKNGVTEIYEGDIIDETGSVKGNVYESPQVFQRGADHIVERMGTPLWRESESIAVGWGCRYAEYESGESFLRKLE